ncbi:hypothetical protein [Granulicella sp. dw_53]|uniref:hypothetical protein n=1 Tax=Granulicella sp. dw_53 TaxID=2719792 RepID=UPI001BD4659D|nr:hypothetical protein [Granulicella sp. dw_53]
MRFDYVASPKDSMFFQYTNGRADVGFPKTPVLIGSTFNPQAFAGANRNNHAPSMQATFQETHMFSSNVVNERALGYTRFILLVTPLDSGYKTSAALGLPGANDFEHRWHGSGQSYDFRFQRIQRQLPARDCAPEHDSDLR